MPTADGFPFVTQSSIIQLTAAPAAAKFVVTRADTAKSFAAKELPALKPNHPNHRRPAPKITYGMFDGLSSVFVSLEPLFFNAFNSSFQKTQPLRLPITNAAARAESPAAT